MSRTYAGYLFRCKHCEKMHLFANGEPRNGIVLPCVDNKYAKNTYEKTDFRFWHGIYWDVCNICVQEVKKDFLATAQENCQKFNEEFEGTFDK